MENSSVSACSTLVRKPARRNLISGLVCPLPIYIQIIFWWREIIFWWPSTRIPEKARYILGSLCIGCLISRHRQRAYMDKGVLFRSLCIFWQSSITRISRGSARALAGSWQQRHA